MKIFVVGATGATGHLLVRQLLDRGHQVKVVVRSAEKLSELVQANSNLEVVESNLLEMDPAALADTLADCDSIASCLGHNLTFKGVFGKPRRLVTDAVHMLCEAVSLQNRDQPLKFVLMNTVGIRNRDLDEHVSFAHHAVITLMRWLIPPQADNEAAADYLRTQLPSSKTIEWVVVRPDTLKDANSVEEYELHPSPTRDALFNPGQTTRINVAHFMAELLTDNTAFQQWKSQMPVIYNKS